MTFLQALYGSQYQEIARRGKDGNKGRFNGNIFLAVFVVLIILTVLAALMAFSRQATDWIEGLAEGVAGYNTGKATGELLAIPVVAACYLVIANTVGSPKNFSHIINEFTLLPEEERAKANKKVLVPFFIILGLFIIFIASNSL